MWMQFVFVTNLISGANIRCKSIFVYRVGFAVDLRPAIEDRCCLPHTQNVIGTYGLDRQRNMRAGSNCRKEVLQAIGCLLMLWSWKEREGGAIMIKKKVLVFKILKIDFVYPSGQKSVFTAAPKIYMSSIVKVVGWKGLQSAASLRNLEVCPQFTCQWI